MVSIHLASLTKDSTDNTSRDDLLYSLNCSLDLMEYYLTTIKTMMALGTQGDLKNEPSLNLRHYWDAVIYFLEEIQGQSSTSVDLLGELKCIEK